MASVYYLYDMGLAIVWYAYGLVIAVFTFIVVTLIETWVMESHFYKFPFLKRFGYSAILNLLSTIAGLPLIILALQGKLNLFSTQDYILAILAALIISIGVEFGGMFFLLKPNPPVKKVLWYTIVANLASYFSILITPIGTIILLILILLHKYVDI